MAHSDEGCAVSKEHGMSTSPRSVRFDDNSMWVELSDGRAIEVPLTWFPRLLGGSAEQGAQVELNPRGLHWRRSTEDIAVAGLLAGIGDVTRRALSAP